MLDVNRSFLLHSEQPEEGQLVCYLFVNKRVMNWIFRANAEQ